MEVTITGKLRPIIEDEFKDLKTGEIIKYKQLQLETEDDKGRIEIDKISFPKERWETLEDLKKLSGNVVRIPCQITKTQNGMRTVMAGDIKTFPTSSLKTA
jgi:hypothetical protein